MKIEEENSKKEIGWFIVIVIIIIGLWFSNLYILKDLENRGSFGDMFGSINALFSGLALAGIIFTILLQRKELGYQRNELKLTREEFKTQNLTLKLQRFENTFFNLVSIHHKIVDSIDFERGFMGAGPDKELKGRDVFKESYDSMSIKTLELKEINTSYMKSYEQLQTDFGHYFRNLYRIVKMVDEGDFVSDDSSEINKIRYKYTSIIRAQLSDYELLWLFYNCLSNNGHEKFKPLVEKYTLFKNIPIDKLHQKEHKDLYEKQAFYKPKEPVPNTV